MVDVLTVELCVALPLGCEPMRGFFGSVGRVMRDSDVCSAVSARPLAGGARGGVCGWAATRALPGTAPEVSGVVAGAATFAAGAAARSRQGGCPLAKGRQRPRRAPPRLPCARCCDGPRRWRARGVHGGRRLCRHGDLTRRRRDGPCRRHRGHSRWCGRLATAAAWQKPSVPKDPEERPGGDEGADRRREEGDASAGLGEPDGGLAGGGLRPRHGHSGPDRSPHVDLPGGRFRDRDRG